MRASRNAEELFFFFFLIHALKKEGSDKETQKSRACGLF